MINQAAPQDPIEDISSHLKRYGMKMNKRTSPGKAGDRINGVGGKVNVAGEGNPNSKSSYSGIFGK